MIQDYLLLHKLAYYKIPLRVPRNAIQLPFSSQAPYKQEVSAVRLYNATTSLPVLLKRREDKTSTTKEESFDVSTALIFTHGLPSYYENLAAIVATDQHPSVAKEKTIRGIVSTMVSLLHSSGNDLCLTNIMPFLCDLGIPDSVVPFGPNPHGHTNFDQQTLQVDELGIAAKLLQRSSGQNLYNLFQAFKEVAVIASLPLSPTADLFIWLPGQPHPLLVEIQVKQSKTPQTAFGWADLQEEVSKSLCCTKDQPGVMVVLASAYKKEVQKYFADKRVL
ncbi:hypothetical protein QOT17_014672, partial [Balamuthia mandrillaris]